MFHSNLLGGIAGLLLTMEGVSLVLSRTALLDIFLQFFVLAGFAALVVDRDQFRGRLAELIADGADLRDGLPPMGPRPWRLVAAIMLGLACGVKWSALSFFVLFPLMSLIWDYGAVRAAGSRTALWDTFRRSWLGAILSLGVASVATYLFTWLGWWAGENSWNRHWADTQKHLGGPDALLPNWLQSLANYHHLAYDFHVGLDSYHPYKSTPWGWWILGRPVLFTYYQTPAGQTGTDSTCHASKCVSTVLLIGTPLMWWAFVPIVVWLLWQYVTTRDWRAGAVWCALLAGWFVWLKNTDRTMFLFYMAPLIPFLVLGMTQAIGTLLGRAREPSLTALRWRPNWRVAAVALYLGIVVADFAWMWPIFVNVPLTYDNWHAHMWFPGWI
jgi:dolichyl-phosphate-mannose-protein mannosyltransferase